MGAAFDDALTKILKQGRVYFGSQWEGEVHHGGVSMVAGTWDIQLHYIYTQETGSDECWSSASFASIFGDVLRPPPWKD